MERGESPKSLSLKDNGESKNSSFTHSVFTFCAREIACGPKKDSVFGMEWTWRRCIKNFSKGGGEYMKIRLWFKKSITKCCPLGPRANSFSCRTWLYMCWSKKTFVIVHWWFLQGHGDPSKKAFRKLPKPGTIFLLHRHTPPHTTTHHHYVNIRHQARCTAACLHYILYS